MGKKWPTKFHPEAYVAGFVTSSEHCLSLQQGENKERHSNWGVPEICDLGTHLGLSWLSVKEEIELNYHKSSKIEDYGRRRHDSGSCRAQDSSNCMLSK